MTAPLEGVRILELTSFVAAPSAAVILSDLGADVIKVEPPRGDPLRGMMRPPKLAEASPPLDPGFEVDNRGKRSVVVAVDHPDGADLVRRLAARVDVLVTNLLPYRQQRYGLDADSLFVVNPRLVHATLTGYGTTGPESWRPGYDVTAFFGRGTVADFATEPGGAPPLSGTGQGDHTSGLALTIAILAGLRQVERTGKGHAVEASLLSTAMWTMACDLAPTLIDRRPRTPRDRRHALSALANRYPCKDGRWVILTMPQPHLWGRFCEAVGRPELAVDPRYDTVKARYDNMEELVDTLDELFATRTAAEWGDLFDAHELVWGPVQQLQEIVDDPQARAAGYYVDVPHHESGPLETVAIPLKVHGADVGPRAAAPRLGQHSWEVLSELGLTDGEIEALQTAGVVHLKIGWATMGDLSADPVTGRQLTQAERYRMLVDGAVRAEATGFWCASVGEHHFCEYIVSAPPVLLAAMAERTSTIRLGTAVALGANNDPVRLAEDYATLDVLSGGRVELVVGRGNLYEHTFTAFGQDPARSREMYDERVRLLVRLLGEEQVDWHGATRAPFGPFTIQPRPQQLPLPVWVGGGSSLDSATFAAEAGLPLMLPGVLAAPHKFVRLVEHYRRGWAEAGHPPDGCRVGSIAHTYVAPTSQEARRRMEPRMRSYMGWVRELITFSTPAMADLVPPFDFEGLITRGPTICGSPAEVVDRIGLYRDTLELDVFLLMCDMGGMPPEELSATLELAGAEVLPHVVDR